MAGVCRTCAAALALPSLPLVATGKAPSAVAAGDLNGDGRPDLAVANYGFDSVSVLLNTCVSAGIHLAISSSNSTVTISWPIPSTEFAFESTTDLGSMNWQPAVAMARTNNSRLEATVPLNQAARYFRLRKP